MITTVQIRLIADSRDEALAAIAELRQTIGTSRISINSPRQGRDKAGDGNPPWLAYGTFQFDREEPPTVVAPPALVARKSQAKTPAATTGPTKRLRKGAATGKTTKLVASGRNVVTPDDIGSQGVFLGYDAIAQRYYAHGVIGPLAGCYSQPVRLKSEAAAIARRWIDVLARTGQRPDQPPGGWRPAPQPPIRPRKRQPPGGKTKRLSRRKP